MQHQIAFHEKKLHGFSFLVTGGAGFIGSNIVAYLLKHGAGHVTALDNFSEGLSRNVEPHLGLPNFTLLQSDLTDYDACLEASKNIDFVFHQGALGSVPRSIEFPLKTNAANVTGFLNMLEASRKNGVKRFVFASSSSVYGDNADLPKVEKNIGKPMSPYAVTKLVNEQYAAIFHRTYGMETIGLRYFNIFGPNQKPDGAYAAVLPLFMKAILENKPPYINGDGEQSRDFTFVENAVKANILAAFTQNEAAFGQVFNVATGANYSVNQLFAMLCEIAGSNLKPIHRDERPGDIRNSLADISKSREILGYIPEVETKEGLKKAFSWFKSVYGNNNL